MLRVSVLGRMRVELDGVELPTPAARRAWSLLAYLALRPGRQPRAELAARFWPDVLDSSARASLRSAAWSLRRALGDAAGQHLGADRDHVWLAPASGLWVDALAFAAHVDRGEDERAVALCRGELLEGFEEEWALDAREAHRERLTEVLERLAGACETAGEHTGAIEWTRRQVAIDPLAEESHRRLIRRLAGSGDRGAALVVYRTFSERLRRELAVAPSAATRELAESLRDEPPVALVSSTDVAHLLPLVGRVTELARLLDVWRTVSQRRGGVATICGDAGIGKTRLASELLARAAGEGAVTASCAALDLGGAAPFGLWAELIRDLLPAVATPPTDAAWPDDLARLTPEVLSRFSRPGPARPFSSPDLERARLMEATVALIEWAARQRPLVLLLEDVHISDAASLELTGYVCRRIATLPVMFILTRRELPRRPDADRLEHALRSRGLLRAELRLDALEPARVAELARSAAPLRDDDVRRVVEVAEGNALLAVETARAIGRGERQPSVSLGAAVRGAFGSLSPGGRSFAEFAAVAARELERAEVLALPIERAVESAVDALDSGMIVARERRIGFRHALLREALYGDLPEPHRARLHEQWAETLIACEQSGAPRRPAEVAHHLRLAGRDHDALQQFVLAGADARAVGALPEAAEYLHEALSIDPARAELWMELAEVEAWLGRRHEAEAAFEHARGLLGDDTPLEQACAWLRHARWFHGPLCVPRVVGESSRQALELLEAVGSQANAERREAISNLAWVEAIAGSVDEAERLLTELHKLTVGVAVEDLAVYQVANARSLASMRRGDFQGAYAPAIAGGEASARAGRPDFAYGCWANVAGAAAAAGDYPRAIEFLDRGDAAVAGTGMVSLQINLLAMRSFLLLRMERRDEARAAADAAHELAERLGEPELLAMADHDRGLVALADAEFTLAADLLAAALAVSEAPISRPLTRLARAEALAGAGRLDEAQDELRATVLEPVRASDFPEALVPRLARVQGVIALQAGDHDLAVRRLTEAREGWRRQVSRLTRWDSLATVLADLGRPVVGLIEPERELERVTSELAAIQTTTPGARHALFS